MIITINNIMRVDSRLMVINQKYLVYPRTSQIKDIMGLKFVVNGTLIKVPLILGFDCGSSFKFSLLATGLKDIREYLFQNDLINEYFNLEMNIITKMRQ